MSLLEIQNLSIQFQSETGPVRAVRNLGLSIEEGEIVGLVGESGSGKSATALSILGLLPEAPRCRITGQIWFEGTDLLGLPERQMRRIRGNEIAMIFQEPMSALNPTFTIGDQISEVIRMHRRMTGKDIRNRVLDLLDRVGIPARNQRFDDYPHQLSGGMRQRVMIAMALAAEPRILLADEPTTALDVTVQAQILDLLRELQAQMGLTVIMVTHSMGVVAELCERVFVLYAGQLAESGPVERVFSAPSHPYTEGLLASVPALDEEMERRMRTIPGAPPDPTALPPGCPFAPRCGRHTTECDAAPPPLLDIGSTQKVACLHPLISPIREAEYVL